MMMMMIPFIPRVRFKVSRAWQGLPRQLLPQRRRLLLQQQQQQPQEGIIGRIAPVGLSTISNRQYNCYHLDDDDDEKGPRGTPTSDTRCHDDDPQHQQEGNGCRALYRTVATLVVKSHQTRSQTGRPTGSIHHFTDDSEPAEETNTHMTRRRRRRRRRRQQLQNNRTNEQTTQGKTILNTRDSGDCIPSCFVPATISRAVESVASQF
mmetsp:Transcript_10844/g.24186  ORF Transcript_10844/g.24186 Transcript_10844/m.24186 type:complete len:207 (-) Transcript_10844:153-773(-)